MEITPRTKIVSPLGMSRPKCLTHAAMVDRQHDRRELQQDAEDGSVMMSGVRPHYCGSAKTMYWPEPGSPSVSCWLNSPLPPTAIAMYSRPLT